ncbi:MAG: hypothetical protein IPN76_00170 [Saprospiraceae bacterium]|nr:hypothetical protein [Saprospiraceae bacterium]
MYELYFKELNDEAVLIETVAKQFGVGACDVAKIGLEPAAKLHYEICQYSDGDFRVRMSLYFKENKNILPEFKNEISFAAEISQRLDTEILVSDDKENPYSWWLLAPGDAPRTVYQVPNEGDYLFIEKWRE